MQYVQQVPRVYLAVPRLQLASGLQPMTKSNACVTCDWNPVKCMLLCDWSTVNKPDVMWTRREKKEIRSFVVLRCCLPEHHRREEAIDSVFLSKGHRLSGEVAVVASLKPQTWQVWLGEALVSSKRELFPLHPTSVCTPTADGLGTRSFHEDRASHAKCASEFAALSFARLSRPDVVPWHCWCSTTTFGSYHMTVSPRFSSHASFQ